jgi:hypothetical protein
MYYEASKLIWLDVESFWLDVKETTSIYHICVSVWQPVNLYNYVGLTHGSHADSVLIFILFLWFEIWLEFGWVLWQHIPPIYGKIIHFHTAPISKNKINLKCTFKWVINSVVLLQHRVELLSNSICFHTQPLMWNFSTLTFFYHFSPRCPMKIQYKTHCVKHCIIVFHCVSAQ